MRRHALFAQVLGFLFFAAAVGAQTGSTVSGAQTSQTTPGFTTAARVEWKTGTYQLSVTHPLPQTLLALPRAEAESEAQIDAAKSSLFMDAVSTLVIDSAHTVSDEAAEDPAYSGRLHDLARAALKDQLYLSSDFSTQTAHFTFPLFGARGIASPLFPRAATPPPSRMGYVPSRVFTGLVIYARDRIPSVGESQDQYAVPALFPRLYDEEMNVFYDRGMCLASALETWGMVGYDDIIDDNAIVKRAGAQPMYASARAVFGTYHTDLVISSLSVRQLLSVPENLEILRQGRVIVIYQSLK